MKEEKFDSFSGIDHKIPYALNAQGELVHVDSVPRGKKCECHCPVCKSPLQARHGKKKIHHFAHIGKIKCSGVYDHTLHLLAEKILKEDVREMILPEYRIKKNDIIFKKCMSMDSRNEEDYIIKSYKVSFDSVEMEKHISSISIRPDCIAVTNKGTKIVIEINVHHAVDDEKIDKIKKARLNCIQISLPEKTPMDKEQIKKMIIENVECKSWINCPDGELYLKNKEEKEIEKYEREHPELEKTEKKNCEKCELCFYSYERKYKELVDNYIDRLLDWALPLAKLSLEDIAKKNISKPFGCKQMGTFVEIDGEEFCLFPDYKLRKGSFRRKCLSTFGFLKQLKGIIEEYKSCRKSHYNCEYFHAKYSYKGNDYVLCYKA